MRQRRQIDSVLLTTVDFGFKKFQEEILNEKIEELKHLNVENMSYKSKGDLTNAIAILTNAKDKIAQMTIRNRWDVFKVLIIEPDVNLSNMMIDMALTNLTAHFKKAF